MEFVRVSFILRNCLREVPDEILLLIMEVYTQEDLNICPSCGNLKDTEVEYDDQYLIDNYQEYIQNSKKRFEEKSWEVCFDCWTDKYSTCGVCALPFGNNPTLLKTTTVKESNDNHEIEDNICVNCFEK